MKMDQDQLRQEQVEYYRARAHEYDEWFFRQGRYDRGPGHREAWRAEVAVVEAALAQGLPPGDVLELACGTGLWTRRLAESHDHVMAIDVSPEAIAINRERIKSDRVTYQVADLFDWVPPTQAFDAVFFGFWLSHVPSARFGAFWSMVKAALKPKGVVFFVDSLFEQSSAALDHQPIDRSGVVRRTLNDGREFRVIKVFYEPADLERRLTGLGWTGTVRSSGRFFLYGSMTAG
jgi:demethylmenaquinone methyltransferase/2-methoxy-6-polyprenyl-1,4-benzoquinol methylase